MAYRYGNREQISILPESIEEILSECDSVDAAEDVEGSCVKMREELTGAECGS